MKRFFVLFLGLSVVVSLAQSTRPIASTANSTVLVASYGKLPLAFEADQGQTDRQVKFLSRGTGYSLFLTSTEAVLELQPSAISHLPLGKRGLSSQVPVVRRIKSPGAVLRMKLLNANPKVEVSGRDGLPGKSNYFIGNDPKKWHTNVRQFAKVRYENVYPGVDLVYYGHQRELEYDFVVQPGANPQAIRLGIEGASRLRLEHGDLVTTSAAGDVHLRSPHIYQEANGLRREVHGRYVIKDKNEVRFEVAAYDRRRALVIDPVLAYATYLGGSSDDDGGGIVVDSAGNAYITGTTVSTDFPTVNAIQPTYGGGVVDAFVTKFNADGSALIYSTYLGGSDFDIGSGIAVDSVGNAYVTGQTTSADFPTANALQPTRNGGSDAFVAKINASGSALVYSTYLGGSNGEGGSGIAVDSAGRAYVTGDTLSADFPTKNAIQPTYAGNQDVFVAKINAAGSALVFSTYLGGSSLDYGGRVAVDSADNVYLIGNTVSTDFPTAHAIQPTYGGGNGDAFVTEINAAGSALVYSTYLGGSDIDDGLGMAVDSGGNTYVTGMTRSLDFPVVNAFQPEINGIEDAFVTKINSKGTALGYSTYLGGSSFDDGAGIAVDSPGNAYVIGGTSSTDFPTVNAIQPVGSINGNAFVTEINPQGSALVYSTYLGGSGGDGGSGIAVDTAGSAYLTGNTRKNFPNTPVAFQPLFGGGARRGPGDAFVAKIAQQTFVGVLPTKLHFPTQVIGSKSAAKKATVTNQGSGILTINKIFIGGLDAGDFAETNTCGSTLAAGASCTVTLTFTPTAKNKRQAGLGVSTPDPGSPDAIALTGTGTVVSLSTSELSFGDQAVGTTSPPQSVTLTNAGSKQLSFSGISIIGTNAGDFSESNTCGTSIAGGASCTISVTFTPTAQGKRKAAVSISDDGGGSPQKVTLTGTGT